MSEHKWSKEQIQSFLANNRFGYQNVDLPYGLATGGKSRAETARRIFPDDLTGKSVLDIGCMYGYFCFEAEKRGARRVVGLEINPENAFKCETLADIKESKCEFLNLDIEHDKIEESFDYVICLNVLHHLRNPIATLDKLISITNERLILEIASFSYRDRKKSRVPAWIAPVLNKLPIIYVGETGQGGKKLQSASQTFFITQKSMDTMLIGQRRSIAKVEFHEEGHKDRYTVIAHKRRINRLVIVAGAPTSGKSTLIQQTLEGGNKDLADKIGLDSEADWSIWRYRKIPASGTPRADNVILHCNITQHLLDGDLYRYGNALLDVIKAAEHVSVVTLWCSPSVLAERYQAERAGHAPKRSMLRRRKKKDRLFTRLYSSETATTALFMGWFNFLKQQVGSGKVVMQEEDNRVIDIAEWESRYWPTTRLRPESRPPL